MNTGAGAPRPRSPRPPPKLHSKGSASAHASLVAACCTLLTLIRWPHSPINQKATQKTDGSWHSAGADEGIGDILGCTPWGRAVFIECKSGDAEQSPEQLREAAKWERAGALVLLVRSVDQLDKATKAARIS